MSTASEIQQISSELLFWQAYVPEVKADLSACAVQGLTGWVLVDPIPLVPEALGDLSRMLNPTAIVLTNGNHTRAAADFRRRAEIPILAHRDAVPELEIDVDREIREGDLIAGDITVFEVAGAGPGEIALHSPRGSLHLGDALINLEPYGFTLLPDKYCRNPKQMRESLRALSSTQFSILTFAHGLPIVQRAQDRFTELIAS